jgi:hypothetical protein
LGEVTLDISSITQNVKLTNEQMMQLSQLVPDKPDNAQIIRMLLAEVIQIGTGAEGKTAVLRTPEGQTLSGLLEMPKNQSINLPNTSNATTDSVALTPNEIPLNVKMNFIVTQKPDSPQLLFTPTNTPTILSVQQTMEISDFLANLGQKPSAENINYVREMIANELPLNRENFFMYKHAVRVFMQEAKTNTQTQTQTQSQPQTQSQSQPQPIQQTVIPEKAAFLVHNGIKPTVANIQIVNEITQPPASQLPLADISRAITETVRALPQEAVSELERVLLRQEIQDLPLVKKLVANINTPSPDRIISRLTEQLTATVPVRDLSPQTVNAFFLEKREALYVLREVLTALPEQTQETILARSPQLLEFIAKAEQHMELYNNMKTLNYIPLPVNIQNAVTDTELYVFKDKKGKRNKESVSALIALDTANLGSLDTYLVKTGQQVSLQFRVGELGEKLIKENISILSKLLNEIGISLSSIIYKERNESLGERFSVISGEESLSDMKMSYTSDSLIDFIT